MTTPKTTPEQPQLTREQVGWFREHLCAWFAHARRDLPWRLNRDPYRVWISESMLQQTRVEAVIEHYRAFLERFPDVQALARAEEDEVLAAWSGLGYYRRARALHRAARDVVAKHAGRFPADRAAALALPGVGPYTAGAVLSIAHGLSEPLVDGNVSRVFARLFGLEHPSGSAPLNRAAWSLAAELVPRKSDASASNAAGPGEWNQGLMELGALVCTPRSPRCESCPLSERCVALASARSESLPLPAVKRAKTDVSLEILRLRRGAQTLFRRRPSTGRMAGLWELPTRELVDAAAAPSLWPSEFPEPLDRASFGGPKELGHLSHAITHHRIRARVLEGHVGRAQAETFLERGEPWRWCTASEAAELALTGMTRKVFARW